MTVPLSLPPLTVIAVAIGAAALLTAAWAMGTFNALVRGRNHCGESWADIDTELRRRYDLIPNLVEAVKGYARHEREVIENLVAARAAAMGAARSPLALAQPESDLRGTLDRLFEVVENYPDLKASENFLKLQEELANAEDRIQRARRFYNANVRDLNNRVEVFPSNLVARAFGFTRRQFFEINEPAARAAPRVQMGP